MRAAQANVDKLMDYYDNISEESGVRQEYGRMAGRGMTIQDCKTRRNMI